MLRGVVWCAALVALAGCAASPGKQEVRVSVTEDGFVPAVVTVERGARATLVITRTTDATCATEAVFAATGAKYPLPLNQPVRIPIDASRADTLRYACGMDMYKGQVVVR